MVETYVIYSKLRLFLYFIMAVISPTRMNMVIMSAFVVEQLINIFDGRFIYTVMYIRS